jgi:hypothetical protein
MQETSSARPRSVEAAAAREPFSNQRPIVGLSRKQPLRQPPYRQLSPRTPVGLDPAILLFAEFLRAVGEVFPILAARSGEKTALAAS